MSGEIFFRSVEIWHKKKIPLPPPHFACGHYSRLWCVIKIQIAFLLPIAFTILLEKGKIRIAQDHF